MSKLTKEETKKIAQLANIHLGEEEIEKLTPQIEDILEYVSTLQKVDTKGKKFRSQVDLTNVFRKDEPKDSLPQNKVLQNRSKTSKKGAFVISKVL